MKKEAAKKAHILLDQVNELEKVLNYEKVEFNAQYYVLNISGTIKLPDSMQTAIKELIVNKIKDLETELRNL